jgi:hypothetical protein
MARFAYSKHFQETCASGTPPSSPFTLALSTYSFLNFYSQVILSFSVAAACEAHGTSESSYIYMTPTGYSS